MFLNKLVIKLVTKKILQNTYFIYLLQYTREVDSLKGGVLQRGTLVPPAGPVS